MNWTTSVTTTPIANPCQNRRLNMASSVSDTHRAPSGADDSEKMHCSRGGWPDAGGENRCEPP
jgi:hypothetical protein